MLKKNAYTLIELLIVMAIFALLFGFSFAAYTNFNKNRSLENGARGMETVLRDAQHRAISGEYDQSANANPSDDCNKLIDWKVTWTVGGNGYNLIGECISDSNPVKEFINKTFNLSTVGTIQFSNSGTITFNPFLQAPVSTGNICITMPGADFYKIVVSGAGAINVTKKTTCP